MSSAAAPSLSFFLIAKQRLWLAAVWFSLGLGVPRVGAEIGLPELRSRAESGDADALNALGQIYANGQGVPQDYAQAIGCFRQAVARGHAAAQFNLGVMVEHGRGVPADLATAFMFYLKAAEQGFAPAQLNVGNMYANGSGTGRDYFEAALWFRQAAALGVAEAQYDLGLACELGRGVAKDEALAQKWYWQAANSGFARARCNLAQMLEEGRGSPPDQKKAAELYRAAAQQGFAPAQNNYGLMLAKGRGGLKADVAEAFAWLTLAAENGVKSAGRDLLAPKLTAEQLAEAKEKLSALRVEFAGKPTQAGVAARLAGSATPASPASPAPADLSADLSERLKAAATDLERLRTENGQLAESLRKLTGEKTALEQRVAQTAVSDKTVVELRAQAEKLKRENGLIVAQQQETARQMAALRVELMKAHASASKLAKDSAQAKGAGPDVVAAGVKMAKDNAELTAQSARLAEENRKLSAQIQAGAGLGSRIGQLESELAAAQKAQAGDREPLAKLGAQLDNAGKTIADLKVKNDELQKDLEVAKQSTAAALAAQAAAAKAAPESAALNLELQTLREEVRRLDGQIEDDRATSAREVSSLAAQLQRTKESSRALAAANRALLEARNSDDTSGKADMDRFNAKIQTLTSENEKLAVTRQQLTAEKEQLAKDRQAAEEAAADAKKAAAEKAHAEVTALQARLAESDMAVEQHNASVAELTGAHEKLTAEKAALQAQLTQSQQALAKTRDELTSLESRLAASDQLAEKNAASASELGAANEKLQTQAKDLTAQVAALREDNARLPQLGAEVTAREKELADLKLRLAEAEKTAEQHAGRVAELTGANEKLAGEKGSLQRQWDAQAAQLSAARAETARLNDTVQVLDRDRAARLAQLQQENTAIGARLRQAQSTLDQIANAARIINGSMGGFTGVAAPARPLGPTEAGVAAPEAHYHVVQQGDSLSRISVRYYGTTNRWQDIYEANRELLKGENALRLGQRLKIP